MFNPPTKKKKIKLNRKNIQKDLAFVQDMIDYAPRNNTQKNVQTHKNRCSKNTYDLILMTFSDWASVT